MIDTGKTPGTAALPAACGRVFESADAKIRALAARWAPGSGAPVFTVDGQYTARGWTEWTQGFQFGGPLLVHEATQDPWMLDYGRSSTLKLMAAHITHTGVHDHGFNNVSTYGTLLRLMHEGSIPEDPWERRYYALALKASGAVQASRWTPLPDGLGYIQSFNGPHSLFADTIRSLRSLAIAHALGHVLMGEQDSRISLLGRLLAHAETTARYNVYLGTGRDRWDIRGRVAHESVFNTVNGSYRCPSSQQGYSPYTTWTRGLAWVMLGFAEELEFAAGLGDAEVKACGLPYFPDADSVRRRFTDAARAVCDFYIETTPPDGIPYWDTGGPRLREIADAAGHPADPYNSLEPVDSSAAAIAAQGLLRLGAYLSAAGDQAAERYSAAGRRTAATLMSAPYLSEDPRHEGLLLHAVYHYPNAWDRSADGSDIPHGESCMWGDYHLLELALWLHREATGRKPQRFFDIGPDPHGGMAWTT